MFLSTIAILAMSTDVSQLASALTHADPAERSRAAEQLSRLGPDAGPAAVALVRACGDPTEEVREWIVAALEKIESPSAANVEDLASLTADENADAGYWAATLLGRLGEEAAPAVAALARAVSGDVAMAVRQRAAWALGKIGPAAAPAVESLREAATEDDARLARLARRAIDEIGR